VDPLLIAGVGIFGALGLTIAVVQDYVLERRRFRATFDAMDAAETDGRFANVRQQQLSTSALGRVVVPGLRRMGRFARRFTPLEVYDRLDQELVYAGNPPGWDTERVLAFKLFLPVVLVPLMLVLGPIIELPFVFTVAAALLFGAVGYYGPEWLVRSRSGSRQHAIQLTLPDSLDLLSITVEAGLSFDAALARVARNIRGPLGEELFRVVQEMQLGKARSEALRDLGSRSTVDDLRSFVLAMVQADVFGIPIARVLKVQAREMRIRRRQRAEEQAQKLPVKIVFPVVLCIFPSIFVVLLGPAAIQIYDAIIR
jgi:tight adherence protein C